MPPNDPSTPGRTASSRLGGMLTGLAALAVACVAAGGAAYLASKRMNSHATAKGAQPAADGADRAADAEPDAAAHDDKDKPVDRVPPFYDWPAEAPLTVLCITGEADGHMRPCGCSADQVGGFSRRAGLAKLIGDKKWPQPVFLDLGQLIKSSGPLENLRYRYMLRSLEALDYSYAAIGPDDLSFGISNIVGEALNLPKPKLGQAGIRSTDANFQGDLEAITSKMEVIDRGGKKIAVASLIGEEFAKDAKDQTIKVRPSAEVAAELAKAMSDAKADVKVLLAHLDEKAALELAKREPSFDLIVCRSRLEDSTRQEAKTVGKTMVAWVGRKAKAVGVVGLFAAKAGEPTTRFELVTLDKRIPESDRVNEVFGEFVAAVKRDELAKKWPRLAHPSGSTFTGSEACGQCHLDAFNKWKTTKHGHAMESLTKASPAGQDYNPECIKCHSTGFNQVEAQAGISFGYKSGFVTLDETPKLAGNGCENCHGPGSKHADDPFNREFVEPMRRSQATIADRCVRCHDADNSLHWNFATYWPKVEHRVGLADARERARMPKPRKPRPAPAPGR